MADAKLKRNQLLMLLKKRTYIGDNELYEMMRSRQVYHVQTELRKELDRTIKAIQHAEKLRVSGFMTQKAMFLKKVDILEKNRQHLTDVRLSMSKLNPNNQHGDLNFHSREGKHWYPQLSRKYPDVKSTVVSSAPDKTSVSSNTVFQNGPDNHEKASFKGRERAGSVVVLPSVNGEWMTKVREESCKDTVKTTEKEDDLLPKLPRDNTGTSNELSGQCKKSTRETIVVPESNVNVQSVHEQSFADQRQRSLIHTVHHKKQSKNTSSSKLGQFAEMKHSGPSLENGKHEVSVNSKNDEPKKEMHVSGGEVDTYPYKKHNRYSKPDIVILSTDTQATVSCDVERVDPEHKSDSTASVTHDDSNTTDDAKKNTAADKLVTKMTNLKPVERLMAKSRSDYSIPYKQKSTSDIHVHNSQSLTGQKQQAMPKLPYLRRSRSHPTLVSRKRKSKDLGYLNLAGNLERTVTMIFVEDPSCSLEPPQSQFDFDAWLAYNRRKRGYTKILDEKQYVDIDNESERRAKKSDETKGKSRHSVRFSFSKAAKTNPESKTFRDKSREWYQNFLKLKRNSKERSDLSDERGSPRRLRFSLAGRTGLTLLPRLSLKTYGIVSKATETETSRDPAFFSGPNRRAAKEATEQRLQRLKDQSEGLQVKVQNFVASPRR